MRIAVVAPSEIPARRANTVQVMKMAQAMAALGHDVRLVAPASKDALLVKSADWDSLAYHYGLQTRFQVEWLPVRPCFRRYDLGLAAVNWARDWGASLLYTRLPQAAAIASLRGMATILEVHDMPQGKAGPLLFRIFLRGRGARRLVVITRSLLKDLRDRLAAPEDETFTLVAPDGVDLSRYTNLPGIQEARQLLPERVRQQLSVERMVAGYTGHLYRGRGVELMLEVACRLPEIVFLLVGGEPNDVQNLEVQVRQKGLSNVILAGFVPNAELPVYQAACNFLLMPYQQHVAASSGGDIASYLSPMKLFEYMACGRPILSSNLPVLQEVLQPEFAILLPPQDANAWVAALRGLAGDDKRRAELGQLAQLNAAQYSWEERAKRVLKGIKA
jgi:glycosyltransferase involved in cell wall biosynthesis